MSIILIRRVIYICSHELSLLSERSSKKSHPCACSSRSAPTPKTTQIAVGSARLALAGHAELHAARLCLNPRAHRDSDLTTFRGCGSVIGYKPTSSELTSPTLVGLFISRVPNRNFSDAPTFDIRETPQGCTSRNWVIPMQQPEDDHEYQEFFFDTLKVAAHAAAAHQITKLIKTYPSQRWRSAVVAAYVTCSDDMAKEIAVAFNESVAYVFRLHNVQLDDAKAS